MQRKTTSQLGFDLWVYFCDSDFVPDERDGKAWRALENASGRIAESSPYLDAPAPADVRLSHARRVRASARTARRQLDKLSFVADAWVRDALEQLEAVADTLVVQVLSEEVEQLVIH